MRLIDPGKQSAATVISGRTNGGGYQPDFRAQRRKRPLSGQSPGDLQHNLATSKSFGHIDEIGKNVTGWAFDPHQNQLALALDDVSIAVIPTIYRFDALRAVDAPSALLGYSISFADLLQRWRSSK